MLRRFAALLSILSLLQLSLTAGGGACDGVHASDAAPVHQQIDVGNAALTGATGHAASGAVPHGGCDVPATSPSCASVPGCGATALPPILSLAAGVPPDADAARPAAPLAPPSPVRAPELPPPRA